MYADPDSHLDPATDLRFEDGEPMLLALLTDELELGRALAPMLFAFAGERPLGSVRLRPHDRGELTTALVEVLALLLPLGADRIVLALPGRASSLRDPIPPVTDDADLRQRVVVVVAADGHAGPCRLSTRLHPLAVDEQGRTSWLPPIDPGGPADAPALDALQVALDRRAEVAVPDERNGELAAQLGRVLLLGHELTLAPPAAALVLTASAATR